MSPRPVDGTERDELVREMRNNANCTCAGQKQIWNSFFKACPTRCIRCCDALNSLNNSVHQQRLPLQKRQYLFLAKKKNKFKIVFCKKTSGSDLGLQIIFFQIFLERNARWGDAARIPRRLWPDDRTADACYHHGTLAASWLCATSVEDQKIHWFLWSISNFVGLQSLMQFYMSWSLKKIKFFKIFFLF